ncbi:lipopolysaccharide biosynthesis protein, partial [Mesorhizobium sp. M2D.F.Ca.ET.145.01.1.1]
SIFLALGFAGLLQPLNNPAGWLFVSQGRSGDFMRWGIITAVTSVLAFALGLPYGALGVAVAYAVSEYLRTPFPWLYVGRSGPLQAGHVLRAATPFVLGAHLALGAVWLVKPMLPQQHVVALASGAILAYAITIVVALAFAAGREALREALKMLPARTP